MNGMRKLLCILAGVVLAAFALPAAADKVYQLTMSSPSPLAAGATGQSVSMQINNISNDTGNSNSSSFKLNAPSGFTIQQVYTVSRGQTKNAVAVDGGYTATIQVLSDGSAVWVSNIQLPLKPFGAPLQLKNMKVDVSCSPDTNGLWVLPGVWTGSGFNGQTFTLNTTQYPQYPSTRNTPVSGVCANYTITPSTTTPVVSSGSGSVSLSFNNTSPTGGATIGSLTITAPTNFTIQSTSTTTSGSFNPPIPAGGATSVTVTGASVGPGSSLTLNLNVKTPSCASAPGAAWTGVQVTSTTNAAFSGPGTGPTTAINALPCSIGFDGLGQPATTFAGYPVTTTPYNNPVGGAIKVNLQIDGAAAPDGTAVTLGVGAGACGISSGGSSTTSGGVATFDKLKMNAGTSCKLTASGGGVGPSAPSSAFDIVGPDGTLSCASTGAADAPIVGNLDPLSNEAFTGNADSGLVRGLNLDGTCGDPVPYSFSYDSANHSAMFIEDSLGQHTSVEYVILWAPVSIDSDGWAGKQPCASWGVTNPIFTADATYGCKGDYEPALFCLSDNVDAGNAVMPYIPNVAPYNLPATETQYQYGIDPSTGDYRKAKVCVAQQGMTSASGQVQYWTKFIDQADGGVRLP